MKAKFKIPFNRLVLPIFVLGLISIILLKVIENRSIDTLVDRNIYLLSELELHNKLQNVDNESRRIDAELRQLMKSTDKKSNQDIRPQIEALRVELDSVNAQEGFSAQVYAAQLSQLFKDRANIQEKAIIAYNVGAKDTAQLIISSAANKMLRDSINSVAIRFTNNHKLASLEVADSIRKNGKEVHTRSIIFVVTACFVCLLVCYYLLRKKRQSELSEKRVIAAASVKENFLANMSHEIRTPLNTILGFTNILQRSRLDEEQQKHINIISTSGNNLLSIVNDILDLSKIEAGMMRIEQAPFRVTDVMASLEGMLSQKAEEKNLKLIIKVDSEIPDTLSGDAVRLTQVLVNLVSNAIKFTQEGGVYVRVTPYKQDGEILSLEFLIRDTGIGIAKDKQKDIFERFEQAEAATTRRFGGTGLGLSIVKHLIDLQTGTINLSSEQGYGTSFLVVIPYKLTNEEAPSLIELNKNQDNHPPMEQNLKILVAEDNTLNQHLMRHLLKGWGFNFEIVANGALAVEAIKKEKYDLILMDIQMPEMDGHTATRVIRNDLKSDIAIIAMTAHAMAGEREKCLASGMNDYISKPIDEKKLQHLINQYSNSNVSTPEPIVIESIANAISPLYKAKVINLQYVDEIAGGDAEFKRDIIREFVQQVPTKINTMEKAIQDKNFQVIRSIAHEMKTTVHFLGLSVLIGHLLQKIEDLAANSQALLSIHQMFESIKSVCLQAVQEAVPLVA